MEDQNTDHLFSRNPYGQRKSKFQHDLVSSDPEVAPPPKQSAQPQVQVVYPVFSLLPQIPLCTDDELQTLLLDLCKRSPK